MDQKKFTHMYVISKGLIDYICIDIFAIIDKMNNTLQCNLKKKEKYNLVIKNNWND